MRASDKSPSGIAAGRPRPRLWPFLQPDAGSDMS